MAITFDTETIRLITLFENITGVMVKDCFINEGVVYFLVDEGKVGMAIGRNGSIIKNVEKIIGKKVKVFEYKKNPVEFIKKIIPNTISVELVTKDGKQTINVKVPKKVKPLVIGRNGRNIKIFRTILKRNYKIEDIKVR